MKEILIEAVQMSTKTLAAAGAERCFIMVFDANTEWCMSANNSFTKDDFKKLGDYCLREVGDGETDK